MKVITPWTPSYNHMEKADLVYSAVEDPKGINLIMFRDSSVKFLQKWDK